MKTPIEQLKPKYASANAHLDAIIDAMVKQFKCDRVQAALAVRTAYDVGRGTTTTDDWCNEL